MQKKRQRGEGIYMLLPDLFINSNSGELSAEISINMQKGHDGKKICYIKYIMYVNFAQQKDVWAKFYLLSQPKQDNITT